MKKVLSTVLTVAVIVTAMGIFAGCDKVGNSVLIVQEVYLERNVDGWTVNRIILFDDSKKEDDATREVVFSSDDPASWFENVSEGSVLQRTSGDVDRNAETGEYFLKDSWKLPVVFTIDTLNYNYEIYKGFQFAVRRNGEDGFRLMTDKTESLND